MAGLSDVGLKKLLKSHGVVTPPQGHWNRVHAGKPVPKCPKLPAGGIDFTVREAVACKLTRAGHHPGAADAVFDVELIEDSGHVRLPLC